MALAPCLLPNNQAINRHGDIEIMAIIGIDPGVTGAIAFIHDNGEIEVEDMPVMTADKKGKRKQINASALHRLIEDKIFPTTIDPVVFMERTHAMPRNGVIAAYSQGDSNGCIRTVCALFGFQMEKVTPRTWKKHYGLTSDKEAVRARAIEIFPDQPLSRKKDHNRAEALLIAKFGQQELQG